MAKKILFNLGGRGRQEKGLPDNDPFVDLQSNSAAESEADGGSFNDNDSDGTTPEDTVVPEHTGGTLDKDKEEIVDLIVECSNSAIDNPTDDKAFQEKLHKLTEKLKTIFNSEYCAIGKVTPDYVEDCVVAFKKSDDPAEHDKQKKNLYKVKRVTLDDGTLVCKALDSGEEISYFSEKDLNNAPNATVYKENLCSGELNNTTIILIKDKNGEKHGFIQFVNSNDTIDKNQLAPYSEDLLRLALVIKQRDSAKESRLAAEDLKFFLYLQDNVHDVDELLKYIMRYLAKEFHAGIITFRIPVLVGVDRTPEFVLRDCFIKDNDGSGKNYYFKERLIRDMSGMGGLANFKCRGTEQIIVDTPMDDEPYKKAGGKEQFHEKNIIIPIPRDYSKSGECAKHEDKQGPKICQIKNCPELFGKYYGIFRLRILKSSTEPEAGGKGPWKETHDRLSYLAKHIAMVLSFIADRYETDSLETLKSRLKETSFIKISEYDKHCSEIIKDTIGAKSCSIYRYDYDNDLVLSATTTPSKLFSLSPVKIIDLCDFFQQTIDNCRSAFSIQEETDKIIEALFSKKKPIYYMSDTDSSNNSMMLVPLMKKDDSKLGIMLLVGKGESNQNISNTYWELDKEHVELIADILTRIEESDAERQTFLSQLSHELLRPITELVYENEFINDSLERDKNAFPKERLIQTIKSNLSLNRMFKYLIADVEQIYSLSKGEPEYNLDWTDVKELLIQTIKLFETEAAVDRKIKIATYLDMIPPHLYVDRERLMSVFINLIKNAIRYAYSNSEISIVYNYNEATRCHEIDFADYGIPIAENDKDSIFRLFYRTQEAKKRVQSGSGMGLYLVKEIMKGHHGDCYVKQLDNPTIFTISIPDKQ